MTGDAIAVIGMACQLPGAADLPAYWAALRAGTEGISRFDLDALVAAGADPDEVRRPDFVPARGVLAGSHLFDWRLFGYSRAEAAAMDPQQRVFLQCAAAAVDDAGLDPARFPGRIGVYAGADKVTPPRGDDLSELARAIGTEKDFLASRVSYKLGLRGPALAVQTACSTSLTSVHLAVQSLRTGDCDVALAGGVTVLPRSDHGYFYEPGGILSPDGHCRPFDVRAGGTVPSEGVGVVVLKRAADAVRDGDHIAALVLGSAINNDGAEKIGYTAPSITGQSEAIRHAQHVAGIDPADISYVEAHGTATKLGDPIEVEALTDAFGRSRSDGACWLGAVKSNIGHTGAAAGVAGLIKVALLLEHRELVPTVHYTQPNPLLDLELTPFRVVTRRGPWPDRPELAAVSSFGLGGSNAHVVLSGPPRPGRPAPRPGPRLLVLSASTPDALHTLRDRTADRLGEVFLPAAARTLAGRRRFPHRAAFVAGDTAEAARVLRDGGPAPEPGDLMKVAFLFPGQGTLRGPAGAAAYRLLPRFRETVDEIRAEVDVDLGPVVAGTGDEGWFRDTVHQQLGLFALGCGLAAQLREWGVRPAVLLGNSIGEYVAATLAGTWTVRDAARLVRARARAMADTAPGLMASVTAPASEVRRRIGAGAVTVAIVTPGASVLSGPRADMEALLAGSTLDGLEVRRLEVERAFHSGTMDPAAEVLRAAVAAVQRRVPNGRLIANTTGAYADPEALRSPEHWAEHLRRPVLLDTSLATLLESGCDTYVELGPGTSMLVALRRSPGWDPSFAAIPLLGRAGDEERGLLRGLGALWERGADRAPEVLTDDVPRVPLPAHPFDAADPDGPEQQRTVTTRAPRSAIERAWCDALGVASAAPGDDFFALGGESLTAVDLLSRIRRETGRSISVTEFTRTPTFADLRRLSEVDLPGPVRVVALNDGGPGRPLFLAADAAGSALSYRTLATGFGGVRPVLGLEPTEDGPSLADSAAQHVDALRTAQPHGPYTVGGWSYGAVVAHEVARQLTAAGETVDVLLALDGYPRTRAELAREVLQIPLARRDLRRTLLAKYGLMARYRPAPAGCPALLVTAGRTRPPLRLRHLYDGVRVLRAAGDHWSMLTPPYGEGLAHDLAGLLPGRLPYPARDPDGRE